MQKKVQIISDGSQDLSSELSKEKDIEVVPFYVSFDGEHYYKEIEEITVRDFYQQMVDHPDVFPKTSMPSVQDFYEVSAAVLESETSMNAYSSILATTATYPIKRIPTGI